MQRTPRIVFIALAFVGALLLFAKPPAAAQDKTFAPQEFNLVDNYLEGNIMNVSNMVQKDVVVTVKSLSRYGQTTYWQGTARLGDIEPGAVGFVRLRYGINAPAPEKLSFDFKTAKDAQPPQRKALFGFKGDGQGYSEWFTLPAGVISLEYTYTASWNGTAQIGLENRQGKLVKVIFDETLAENATREGIKTLRAAESASYRLNVVSPGSWTVDIFQENAPAEETKAVNGTSEEAATRPAPIKIRQEDSGVTVITH